MFLPKVYCFALGFLILQRFIILYVSFSSNTFRTKLDFLHNSQA